MSVSLVLILLLTSSTKAENLDLSVHQEDVIAAKLKEGEVCKQDLKDCKDAFEKDGSCNPGPHILGGAIGGAALMALILELTGAIKR